MLRLKNILILIALFGGIALTSCEKFDELERRTSQRDLRCGGCDDVTDTDEDDDDVGITDVDEDDDEQNDAKSGNKTNEVGNINDDDEDSDEANSRMSTI